MSSEDDHTEQEQRWAELRAKVAAAALRSGRAGDAVTIIAVSKTVSADQVRRACCSGWDNFGENRVQELIAKQSELSDLNHAVWHLIGQLQSNKVKDVIGKVAFIHSLDRLSLAEELQRQAEKNDRQRVRCFVEVNVAGEASKAGLSLAELKGFVESMAQFPLLELTGLMTVAPISTDPEQVRPVFRALAQARAELQRLGLEYAPMQHLSMGMSADYQVAIEEGADFVRLGTVIFGARI